MIRRGHFHSLIHDRLRRFPAVAVVGPRQCGKTTLARELAAGYFNLEAPEDRLKLDATWPQVMKGPFPVVLDEAQCWPEVFSRLRGEIDAARKKNGRFILLGSIAPSLMRGVSESLAGRMATVELTPFTLAEVPDPDRLWRFGGYPDGGVLEADAYPVWADNYLRAMAERDLPTWGLPAKPLVTQRLFRMLAAEQGSMLNLSKLGQNLGLSYHTVSSYLDYLEGTYLIRRLPAYTPNLRKRLAKTPRVYWRDSGLLHALLKHAPGDDLFSQPWVGASWEGFVIEQILAAYVSRDEHIEAFYFRTHDGYEADLVIDHGRTREVIEIKLSSAPSASDQARLDVSAHLVKAAKATLICTIAEPIVTPQRMITHLSGYLRSIYAQEKPNR
jgi:predicted AAA+ superfamily ATPase